MWSQGRKPRVSGAEEVIKKCKVTQVSSSLSLYLTVAAGINGTFGAAISTGLLVDVETSTSAQMGTIKKQMPL